MLLSCTRGRGLAGCSQLAVAGCYQQVFWPHLRDRQVNRSQKLRCREGVSFKHMRILLKSAITAVAPPRHQDCRHPGPHHSSLGWAMYNFGVQPHLCVTAHDVCVLGPPPRNWAWSLCGVRYER